MNIAIASDEGFEKFLQTIGAGLCKAREASGYSLQTVAAALKIPDDQLDRIEQGKLNWEVNVIASLCDYYDVSIKQLL